LKGDPVPEPNLAALRKERGLSQPRLASAINRLAKEDGHNAACNGKTVSAWETGARRPSDFYEYYLAGALGARRDQLVYPPLKKHSKKGTSPSSPRRTFSDDSPDNESSVTNGALRFVRRSNEQLHPNRDVDRDGTAVATPIGRPDLDRVELLRRDLDDLITEGAMTNASLDDWERTVLHFGQAARHRPPGVLLEGLTADLAELKRALSRRRSAFALRRLIRVTAQMSGLMCLTLVKLDERTEFRRWARTARVAAEEAGDPLTHSWVLAQEAYGHYYSGDLIGAVDVAYHAQDLVGNVPCVGAALAAALEARAHAALGRRQETREALARAETFLAKLDADLVVASAFGYTEAQLRFHEGNAYTHLRDTRSAWRAQERALELCPSGDYMDRAFTKLDRASCLAHDGDTPAAVSYATETLVSLSDQQRQGIITLRAHEIVAELPRKHQALPPVRELRDLLMLTAGTKGVEHSWSS
jgi:transcriptional regulator with XRE-family HTH domain/tetratricopeptide (TPR) repeat protein